MTSSLRIATIRDAALLLAVLIPVALAPLAGAQTLDPLTGTAIERFPVRVEDGEFIDPYSADFAPVGDNGYYAVRFEAPFDGSEPARLLGQRFGGQDLPVNQPRVIGTGSPATVSSLTRLQLHRGGDPLLALWRARGSVSTAAVGRFLHANGVPLSPVLSLGFPVGGNFLGVAFGTPEEALVVWSSISGTVRGRIVSADGSRSRQLVLTGTDARGPVVAANEEGRYLLIWREFRFGAPSFDLWARWIEPDGHLTGGPFVVATEATGDPEIAMWPDGRSAITWTACTDSGPPARCEIRLQFLDQDGQPTGSRQTISPDDGRGHAQPVMAIGEDGVLFVSWQVYPANPGTFPGDVLLHAVAFDAEGERLATAPVVEIPGEVARRRVVALSRDFFVSWYGFNAHPDGVYAMRYRFTPAEGDDGGNGGGGEEPPPVDPPPPAPPAGAAPLTSPEVPGFRFWVRITAAGASILGSVEPVCIPETVCVSGALSGRSEVFLRVVGPRPNGFLWPTIVKFTTSRVEVWIEQESTGEVRYYELEGAAPASSELPGLFDRTGFQP